MDKKNTKLVAVFVWIVLLLAIFNYCQKMAEDNLPEAMQEGSKFQNPVCLEIFRGATSINIDETTTEEEKKLDYKELVAQVANKNKLNLGKVEKDCEIVYE